MQRLQRRQEYKGCLLEQQGQGLAWRPRAQRTSLQVSGGTNRYTSIARDTHCLILVTPWPSTFVNLLGPPMEQRSRATALALPLEGGAPGELRVFEFLDGGEVLVDQGRIGQWPEMLGGLQFRGIGGR